MSKTETSAAGKKAAYISPNVVCIAVEYSLCAGSPSDGGHKDAEPDPDPLEPEDDEQW
ncbi:MULTISPECIES: hypothetical protein [Prevotellaceae]|uniref:hypothetical protein n=1 Tax=Prevotellaceae TaxID=171552 RepID=UPI00201D3090|nr:MULTISPECIES: hypothetical protein [Prevotella]MBS6327978.1 hypothetical protein [Prevotella bivia]MDU3909666.1 hypothetical protein [Prevotella bivia]MDU7315123.1 hypothetical protein [Prevotella bivia]MDZ3818624.1 hypothetical protein [Prevotella bivia]